MDTGHCSVTHCTPLNTLPRGIRVITTLLEHKESTRTSDAIISAVMCRLDPMIDLRDQVADVVQEVVGKTRKVEDCLYRTPEEVRDELQCGLELVREDIKQSAECVKNKTIKLAKAVTMPSTTPVRE